MRPGRFDAEPTLSADANTFLAKQRRDRFEILLRRDVTEGLSGPAQQTPSLLGLTPASGRRHYHTCAAASTIQKSRRRKCE